VVDAAVMALFPNLKAISNFGTGYEFIDAAHAASTGIPTGHTPGCLSETVADFAWASEPIFRFCRMLFHFAPQTPNERIL
jgi:lactate dehydrogenase-like 2-hydroxyacid dehydrogenase